MKKFAILTMILISSLISAQVTGPLIGVICSTEGAGGAACSDGTLGITDETYTTAVTGQSKLVGQQWTVPHDMWINSLSVYHDGLDGDYSTALAVYADNGSDQPSDLISATYTASQVFNGWNTLPLTVPVFAQAGEKLWLTVGSESIQLKYVANASALRAVSVINFASNWYSTSEKFPLTFDLDNTAAYDYAIHANFTCDPVMPTELTFVTRSRNASWSPSTITKSGGTLTWTAVGADGTSYGSQNANDPTFDFSGNTAMEDIILTVSSPDGWSGLTWMDFWVAGDADGGGSHLYHMDVRAASSLTYLNTRYCHIMGADLSNQTLITDFTGRGRSQWPYGLDLSAMTSLEFLQIDGIIADGFSRHKLPATASFDNIKIYDITNGVSPSSYLDELIILADAGGVSSGSIQMLTDSPAPSLTPASYDAYQSLAGKGWTIDISSVSDLYPVSDAASFGSDEAASVSLWSSVNSAVISADASQSFDGSHSVKLVSAANANSRGEFVISGLTTGQDYTVSATVRTGSGSSQMARSWGNCSIPVTEFSTGGEWVTYYWTVQPTATSITVRFYPSNDGVAGEELWLDRITVGNYIVNE